MIGLRATIQPLKSIRDFYKYLKVKISSPYSITNNTNDSSHSTGQSLYTLLSASAKTNVGPGRPAAFDFVTTASDVSWLDRC